MERITLYFDLKTLDGDMLAVEYTAYSDHPHECVFEATVDTDKYPDIPILFYRDEMHPHRDRDQVQARIVQRLSDELAALEVKRAAVMSGLSRHGQSMPASKKPSEVLYETLEWAAQEHATRDFPDSGEIHCFNLFSERAQGFMAMGQ